MFAKSGVFPFWPGYVLAEDDPLTMTKEAQELRDPFQAQVMVVFYGSHK